MAATPLDTYMPYDSGPGANVTEDGWRKFAKWFRGDGIIRGAAGNKLNTFGDSSGMQIKIDTGEVWIQGAWGQNAGLKTLPVTNNSSGNPRIDLVIARNDFVANRIEFDVLQGTPGVTPVAPILTQNTAKWEVQLAPIAVANGAVTITAGNVTYLPQFTDGSAAFMPNANKTITSSGSNLLVTWQTTVTPSSAMHQTNSQTTFKFDRPGMWLITYAIEWNNNNSGARWAWIGNTSDPASFRLGQSVMQAPTGFVCNTGSAMARYDTSSEVGLYVFSDSATNAVVLGGKNGTSFGANNDFGATSIQFYWLGD
ncbi:MAG TPA: hypothetical protein VHV10_04755 [Ktedonobacteraceae bacterium]|nr:hypothetical protein [Ktedonobacteraceae bacterium]